MTEPYTIGGGTYARNLDKGVAFGAMFADSRFNASKMSI